MSCWRRSWKPTWRKEWRWRFTAAKPWGSASCRWCPATCGEDRACSVPVSASVATREPMRTSGTSWWVEIANKTDFKAQGGESWWKKGIRSSGTPENRDKYDHFLKSTSLLCDAAKSSVSLFFFLSSRMLNPAHLLHLRGFSHTLTSSLEQTSCCRM